MRDRAPGSRSENAMGERFAMSDPGERGNTDETPLVDTDPANTTSEQRDPAVNGTFSILKDRIEIRRGNRPGDRFVRMARITEPAATRPDYEVISSADSTIA